MRWLAGRLDDAQQQLRERVRSLSRSAPGGAHARTAGIVAELQAGFEQFLTFAAEAGVLAPAEQIELGSRCWRALLLAAKVQLKYQHVDDPALRYFALLHAALATGKAHVADRRGQMPAGPDTWGWRRKGDDWQAAGVRIGWLDGEDLLLEPSAISIRVMTSMRRRRNLHSRNHLFVLLSYILTIGGCLGLDIYPTARLGARIAEPRRAGGVVGLARLTRAALRGLHGHTCHVSRHPG